LTALFFSGRFKVTVTTPSARSTSSVSVPADDNHGRGLQPVPPARRRTSDYVLLAAAFAVVIGLVLWALIPR
jgi:hypothetical protein